MPMFCLARPREARAVRSWASGISVGRSWSNPVAADDDDDDEDVVLAEEDAAAAAAAVGLLEAAAVAESLMASETGGNNANAPLASLKACEYFERER